MTLLESVVPVAATGMFTWAWTMIAVPLVAAALMLLAGRVADRWGHWVSVAAVVYSFSIAACLFAEMLGRDEHHRAVASTLYNLFSIPPWKIDVGLLVDQLSILFALLITGVGSLIHLYSVGYMAKDERRRRFFAYLNLFVAAMLLLVLADNYLVLFVGWEGVGLASYLLIGFWQHKPSAAAAANKAFIMNRVGDLGMVSAIMSMLAMFGSSKFVDVNSYAGALSPLWATLIGVFLLIGACGKSAQVPLQGWLLDAMEGPTPVSALIHAATMVTAGVYLIVRSHEIFALSDAASLAVAIVGTVTLLAGAWIGCAKDDIKKVLAGSTMSQIGYMILAAGIGGPALALAIFHLLTHGFFKANMFLGAGSVMHAMDDDVNMRHYGGLYQLLPVTFWTFACGYIAIIGFPLFSGFFSKDPIIDAAFEKQPILGLLAIVGAGVTAFYMTRLMFMTFLGGRRWLPGVHPHESPRVMTVPLVVLAIFSVGAGGLMVGWIQGWLQPALGFEEHFEFNPLSLPSIATFLVMLAGAGLGWYLFGRPEVSIPAIAPATSNPLILVGRHDLYGDAINDAVAVHPYGSLARGVVATDDHAVDAGVMGMGSLMLGMSAQLRKIQNGYVRSYALTMTAGVLIVGLVMILSRLG